MNAVLPIGAALVSGEKEPLGSSAEHGQTGPGVSVSSDPCHVPGTPCTLHTIPISHILM